jgi:predicted acetyltransferase
MSARLPPPPGPAMPLHIRRASPAEYPVLRHLYPLYLHDLSEVGGGYTLDAQGLWQPDYLPTWLSESEQVHPLLFRLEGRPVGFAFVGQKPFPYMAPGHDYQLSEFFILRSERRHGLGRRAAVEVFERFRGVWEVAQLHANHAAIAFWRRVISEYTGGAFEESRREGEVLQVFDNRHSGATRA